MQRAAETCKIIRVTKQLQLQNGRKSDMKDANELQRDGQLLQRHTK